MRYAKFGRNWPTGYGGDAREVDDDNNTGRQLTKFDQISSGELQKNKRKLHVIISII